MSSALEVCKGKKQYNTPFDLIRIYGGEEAWDRWSIALFVSLRGGVGHMLIINFRCGGGGEGVYCDEAWETCNCEVRSSNSCIEDVLYTLRRKCESKFTIVLICMHVGAFSVGVPAEKVTAIGRSQ